MSPAALIFVVVLILMFVLFARGPRRRQQAQQQMWSSLDVGDEIVTAGGIYGEITGFQDDDVLVRIAPSLEVRVARRAIAGVIEADDDDEEDEGAESDAEADEEPDTAPAAEPRGEQPR